MGRENFNSQRVLAMYLFTLYIENVDATIVENEGVYFIDYDFTNTYMCHVIKGMLLNRNSYIGGLL